MYSRFLQRCLNLRSISKLPSSPCTKCLECHSITQRTLSTPSKWHGLWEPDDLKLEPDIPEYETINIQIKGYDYPVLESFAKYVHNSTESMFSLENDCWPCPAKDMLVKMFRPRSTNINEKYDLHKYERVVALEQVPSTCVPLLVQFLRRHTPQGVEVTLKEPVEEEEEQRFVPDYDVLELQAQREIIESGRLVKKKKK